MFHSSPPLPPSWAAVWELSLPLSSTHRGQTHKAFLAAASLDPSTQKVLPDLDPMLYKLQSHTTDPRACEKRVWTWPFFFFWLHFSLAFHRAGRCLLTEGSSCEVLGGKSKKKALNNKDVLKSGYTYLQDHFFLMFSMFHFSGKQLDI